MNWSSIQALPIASLIDVRPTLPTHQSMPGATSSVSSQPTHQNNASTCPCGCQAQVRVPISINLTQSLSTSVGATLAVALDANGRLPWVLVIAGSLAVALDACGRPEALWSPAVVRSRVRRRHNAFRIGPAIRRPIESDCFSLDQIIVFFSPAI